MDTIPTHPNHVPAVAEASQWLNGTVADIDGETYYVSLLDRTYEVRRAVSCLVVPEIGDEVCILRTSHDKLYLMHVLSRTLGKPLTIGCPAGLVLNSPKILLSAEQCLRLEGGQLEARFEGAEWFVKILRFTGIELILRSKVAKLFSHAAELLTGRIQVGADRSYRNIAEAEHVRTGVFDVKAEHVAHIRARNTILTARELVKVDASQIHVG